VFFLVRKYISIFSMNSAAEFRIRTLEWEAGLKANVLLILLVLLDF
jgi:hypothetical protein